MSLWGPQNSKRTLDCWELELKAVVSHPVNSRNQDWSLAEQRVLFTASLPRQSPVLCFSLNRKMWAMKIVLADLLFMSPSSCFSTAPVTFACNGVVCDVLGVDSLMLKVCATYQAAFQEHSVALIWTLQRWSAGIWWEMPAISKDLKIAISPLAQWPWAKGFLGK